MGMWGEFSVHSTAFGRLLRTMAGVAVLLTGLEAGAGLTLYVAPDGNDAWSGTLDAAHESGTDGPLATITGARDRLRELRAEGAVDGYVQVLVREGTYPVTEAIAFAPEDSGAPGATIEYAAFPGEVPVIHGGRRITGWTVEGGVWVANVPEVAAGAWDFSALWVNGRRATPARMPNPAHYAGDEPAETDYFYTAGPVMEPGADGKDVKSATKFRYKPGDLQRWKNLDDVNVVVFHSWATSLLRIADLDEANHVVTFTGPARWHFSYWQEQQRYYVEHVFEGLDEPGEWYLDRPAGTVYYIPMSGEDPSTAEVVAPVARQLLRLEGDPAKDDFVEHLTFRGLTFAYTEYPIAPTGHSDAQAAFNVPAAIEAVGARHCRIERCTVKHVGTYGVWFRAGCQDNRLQRCELTDLGAGGVRIGEGASPTTDAEAALRNVVDNNFMHDGGRIFRSAVGVWIGRSSHNVISHNDICDFRYTGISVGWSWGYAESSANHNAIVSNRVHHVGRGQLSDMGGIYTLGVSPGTVIRGNVFHDVLSYAPVSGGWGIYFDEGSTDIVAENNLVYRTLTGTLHQHYGRDNRVVNNILAFSQRGQLIRSREEDHNSFFIERNIVLLGNGQVLGSTWKNGNYTLDRNLYWDTAGNALDFAGRTWENWQAEGNDTYSRIADPRFAAPDRGDFRLHDDSPAFELGFVPFDYENAGLYGDPDWVDKPRRVKR